MRLGVIPTIGPYLLPDITRALARAFPRLQLLWTEARTGNWSDDLKEGSLDGVLLALEADIGDLGTESSAGTGSCWRRHHVTRSSRAGSQPAPAWTSSRARRCSSSTMDIASESRR